MIGCLRENAAVSGPRVVTAADPRAAAAGAGAFAQGGNAFDAALAACFVETVALPMKCGLAGDVVALFRRAGGALETLLSIGPGPRALAAGATLERVGPRSVGIPGAPQGYAALHAYARLGLDRLVAPAVHAAEAGVAWTRVARSYVVEALELLQRLSPSNRYAPGGEAPEVGAVRRSPGLADLLRRFVRDGADLFAGETGAALVAELGSRGGILGEDDLRVRTVRLGPPVAVELPDGPLLSVTPAPTVGPRLARVVDRGLAADEPLVEIVRADRDEARRRGRAAQDGGTSVVAAADDEGNAVVVVHSNSFPRFGSGIVLDSDLVLNNRPGRGFDLDAPPGAANAPAAGRVPQTTLHAWALETPDALFLGATPGGVNQLCWNAQTLRELLAGAEIGEAVTNPRWAMDESDRVSAEAGADVPDGGSHAPLPPLRLRSAQQIIRMPRAGLVSAAADPRAGARALAVY